MSVCKGKMRPIGLTLKREYKKYPIRGHELMLIHACEDCRYISINRIAADDSTEVLLAVFESSAEMEEIMRSALSTSQIVLLKPSQLGLVLQLLGIK